MYVIKFVAHFEYLFGTLGRLAYSLFLPLLLFLHDVIVSEFVALGSDRIQFLWTTPQKLD